MRTRLYFLEHQGTKSVLFTCPQLEKSTSPLFGIHFFRGRSIGRLNDGLQLEGLVLEQSQVTPMHRQLYDQLRQMILSGILIGGARMPSSRMLSDRLGVSRFTVVTALDQLIAEGYLSTVSGSGTFVEDIYSHQNSPLAEDNNATKSVADISSFLSQRAKKLQWAEPSYPKIDYKYLHMSAPDHRLFPHHIWSNLTKEVLKNLDGDLAYYRISDEPSLLEQQIAGHVAISRGIKCNPDEVVVTYGAHHGVNLLAELLLDPADKIAFEEPGMAAVRSIFASHGCDILPMHVDQFGADPKTVTEKGVKLAFVTAAKQQPLTVSMPVKRKQELLNWAANSDVFVIEDDLGSEFRYEGRPIPPLKAMDQNDRVIYIGAFSMSLLQTLRLGFMIMPRELASYCRQLIRVRYRATPQIAEQILARFIQDGHYSRHLHKTRRIYAGRQKILLEVLRDELCDVFEPVQFASGFYNLCYYLDQTIDEKPLLRRCDEKGLGIAHLAYYYPNKNPPKKAMLIGFAASSEEEINTGAKILRSCITLS